MDVARSTNKNESESESNPCAPFGLGDSKVGFWASGVLEVGLGSRSETETSGAPAVVMVG